MKFKLPAVSLRGVRLTTLYFGENEGNPLKNTVEESLLRGKNDEISLLNTVEESRKGGRTMKVLCQIHLKRVVKGEER